MKWSEWHFQSVEFQKFESQIVQMISNELIANLINSIAAKGEKM
jgi:hypothetical protein